MFNPLKVGVVVRFCLLVFTGIALCSSASAPAYAREDAEDNLQQWTMVALRSHIKGRLLGYFEVQPRTTLAGPRSDNQNYFSTLIVRPALGYQVSKAVSVWQGYGWTPGFNPEFRNENRIFQQLLIENNFKHFNMTNRTRLEERFIKDAGRTAVRGRHMIRIGFPLGKAKKWSLIAYDEGFLNFNDTPNGPQSGIDQNRAFGGVNYKFNPHANVDFGYINQYINRPEPSSNRINHVIYLGVNLTVQ